MLLNKYFAFLLILHELDQLYSDFSIPLFCSKRDGESFSDVVRVHSLSYHGVTDFSLYVILAKLICAWVMFSLPEVWPGLGYYLQLS